MTDKPTPDPTALAVVDAPVTFQTLKAIAETDMVPKALKGKPHAMLAAILYGRELGLEPMTSLQEINVIEGRPAPTASLLSALVRRAGHRITPVAVTDKLATARGTRVDKETGEDLESFEFSFTWAMAERAKLTNKDNWKKYPEAMLWWRAVAQLARIFFPEVVASLKYVPEELGDDTWIEGPTDSDGNVIEVEATEEVEEAEVVTVQDIMDGQTYTPKSQCLCTMEEAFEGHQPGCPHADKAECGCDAKMVDSGLHREACPELMTAEEVAELFDGEVVQGMQSTADNTDVDYHDVNEVQAVVQNAEAEPNGDTVELTAEDKAWAEIPHLLGTDPTAGKIDEVHAYLERLCTQMEIVELFPEGSLEKAMVRIEAERFGAGPLRKKDDVAEFAKTLHEYAIKVYKNHNATEGAA